MDRPTFPPARRQALERGSLTPVAPDVTTAPAATIIDVSDAGRLDAKVFLDTLYDGRWLIGTFATAAVLAGVGYAVFAPPVYESNILIQVEEDSNASNDTFSSVSQMFDIKTAASDEIDIINSRLVVGTAVENTKAYIHAAPKRFPIVGQWWSTHQMGTPQPGFYGVGGYLWGQEKIAVPQFDTPSDLYGKPFTITALGNGRYVLQNEKFHVREYGQVGQVLNATSDVGPITLNVTELDAQPGGVFNLNRDSVLGATDAIAKALKITQTSKDSDVIQAAMQGNDPARTSALLTAIGEQYIHQNVERKTAEAEKSIAFLDVQLPMLRTKLEKAEDAYNAFRTKNAALDLSEEGTAVLQQSVDAQNKLADLETKRQELAARFTDKHPAVVAIDGQEAAIKAQLGDIESKSRQLPDLEQSELRLQRDVQVDSDLYTSLLNSAQQLRLASAGKQGNARLVDKAVAAEVPSKPNRKIVVALAALIGVFGGCLIAWLRAQMNKTVVYARDVERDTGLPVYASVPLSKKQSSRDMRRWAKGGDSVRVLAHTNGDSLPIESLRSFRTALQYIMSHSPNNIVVITGPTPGVGKTFTVANLATVLAASNKHVLLIDADMRDGDLHNHFGIKYAPGLSDMIGKDVPFEQAVHRDVLPRLDVLPAGSVPSNPSELLMSPHLARFLEDASPLYDAIIIDTPPVLAVTDAGVLGHLAGSTFVIARQGETTLGQIKETNKRLSHSGVPVNGIVLNGVRARPGDRTYGYGHYTYASMSTRATEA